MRKFILFLTLAMIAAACSDGDVAVNTEPDVAGICLEGEVDCEDEFVVAGDEPVTNEPATDDPISPASGMVVDGGLSVSEALSTDATGVLAVGGFLFIDGEGTRLCEVLAESFPPQCGGVAIPLEGFDASLEETQSEQGITWTDNHVIVFGEIIDGTLRVDPLVSG